MKSITASLALISTLAVGQAAIAQDHVLTFTDESTQKELSLAELDALEQVSFETSTIWTEENVEFSGVPLALILQQLELSGSTLRMTALNDYAVEMPFAEIEESYPIIATRMDGNTMKVRDKGPYWVVYPYDSDPKYQTETTYARSIWQLRSIAVIDE